MTNNELYAELNKLQGQIDLLNKQNEKLKQENKSMLKSYLNMKQTLGYYYYSFLKDRIIKQGSYDYTRINNLLED